MKPSMINSLSRHLVCLGLALSLASGALGANYTWNSTSGSNWDNTTGTGWNTGGAYPNAQDDTATFSQNITANQTITINVGNARVGSLSLTDTSPGNGWVLSGANPLTFDSSSGTATVNVGGAGAGSNTHLISAPIVTGNQLVFNVGASGRLGLSGNNSGATGGMTISGGGSGGYVRFDSAASLGSPGSTVTVGTGNTAVIGFNTLSSTDLARFAGSSGLLTFSSTSPAGNINLTGFNEYFRIGAATIPISGNMSTLTGTFTPPSSTFRFGGGGGALVVAPTLADGTGARSLDVFGPERVDNTTPSIVALTGANTYTGPTEARNGVLRLAGTSGSALNTAAFNVRPGAFLQLDAGLNIFGWSPESGSQVGNNNNRVADTTAVNLYGGRLNFFGNPATGTSETIGALNVNSGLGVLDARWKAGSVAYDTGGNIYTDRGGAGTGAAVLTAQSLNLNNGAQLWLRGVNVGVAGSSATRVMLNTTPTMVGGGGGAGSTTINILPGVFKTTGLATSQNSGSQNWVTYDGAVGLKEITAGAGEYYAFSPGDVGTSTDNNALYEQTGPGTTLNISSATTVNSMKFRFEPTSGDMTISGTGPLVVKSGNVMVEGNPPGDGRNFNLNVPLDFNGRAGQVFYFNDSFTGYRLNSPMSNTGGNGVSLSAFNTGSFMSEVSIGGNNTYTGPTAINAGNWLTSASERLPNASDLQIHSGARLTVGNGFTETVASLAGAGTLALGNTSSRLILGSGTGTAGAVVLNGASAYIAPGDLGTGTLTLGGANLEITSGALQIELGSLQSSDLLQVLNGNVTIAGGTLEVSLLNGFKPSYGDQWKIIDLVDGSKTLNGFFLESSITFAPLVYGNGDILFFETEIIGNDLYLQANFFTPPAPEPTSFLLLGVGALGLIRQTRRRRGAA